MESLPLLAAAAGSAAGDCPPAAACAENPSYAAAGAACSMYEESRKASVDAPLDVTGMLASPAPVTAVGDLQPPPHQAESQLPGHSGPPQQQALEQAKSAAAPVDPYQYLLALSNFPSPSPGLRGAVGGTNGRGDEASGNGAGDFATAYLNQAAAPGAAAGSTMMEVCSVPGGCVCVYSNLSIDQAVPHTHIHLLHTLTTHSWPARRMRRAI